MSRSYVGAFACIAIYLVFIRTASGQALEEVPVDTGWRLNTHLLWGMEMSDDLLYLGGAFNYIGQKTGSVVSLETGGGVAADIMPYLSGLATAMVPDGAGGWFYGGASFAVDDVALSAAVIHVLPDNTVDAAWSGPQCSAAKAMVVAGGTLFVCATMSLGTGQPTTTLLALDAATGALRPWSPIASGVETVFAVGDTVYVGGKRTMLVNGVARGGGAALSAADGTLLDWDPRADSTIYCLAEQKGAILAGGSFFHIGGGNRSYYAVLDAQAGDLVPPANSYTISLDGAVLQIESEGDYTLLYGDFSRGGGVVMKKYGISNVIEFPLDDPTVNRILLRGGKAYIATSRDASFLNYRGQVVCYSLDLEPQQIWRSFLDSEVSCLAGEQGAIRLGGTFTSVGGAGKDFFAVIDTATNTLVDWDAVPNDWVTSISLLGDTLYVAGFYTEISGIPRDGIAALDRRTGQLLPWNPVLEGYAKRVLPSKDGIFVTGAVKQDDGTERAFIVKLDPVTGEATPWSFSSTATGIHDARIEGDRIYVVEESYIGGVVLFRVGVYGTGDDAPVLWSRESYERPTSIGMIDGAVYCYLNNSQTRVKSWGAFSTLTGAPLPWQAPIRDAIYDGVVRGDELIIGGTFYDANAEFTGGMYSVGSRSARQSNWRPTTRTNSSTFQLVDSGDGVYAAEIGQDVRTSLAFYPNRANADEGSVATHSVDQDGDQVISLSELLRAVQLYNAGGYHCADFAFDTEDGFVPGPVGGALECARHDLDEFPGDGKISLNELLRAIQFYNSGCYVPCPSGGSEDGFCVCGA